MGKEGAIEMLIGLLNSDHELIQRQAAKALANLGVNIENKKKISEAGGIPRLIRLARQRAIPVKIEAIAALANLAVNDSNELDIVQLGGLEPIVDGVSVVSNVIRGGFSLTAEHRSQHGASVENYEELGAQCARALRNLSVHPDNKAAIVRMGTVSSLLVLAQSHNERISQQAARALR